MPLSAPLSHGPVVYLIVENTRPIIVRDQNAVEAGGDPHLDRSDLQHVPVGIVTRVMQHQVRVRHGGIHSNWERCVPRDPIRPEHRTCTS